MPLTFKELCSALNKLILQFVDRLVQRDIICNKIRQTTSIIKVVFNLSLIGICKLFSGAEKVKTGFRPIAGVEEGFFSSKLQLIFGQENFSPFVQECDSWVTLNSLKSLKAQKNSNITVILFTLDSQV